MNVEVIKEFKGEYFFLSNFYMSTFDWRGADIKSVEHGFQSAKMLYLDGPNTLVDEMMLRIQEAPTPKEAKEIAWEVSIDTDEWNKVRVQHMRELVHAKFSGVPGLAGRLLNTGAAMLVEGNTWGDKFWGRCNGAGKNVLGAILMEERGYWLHSDFSLTERTASGMMGS